MTVNLASQTSARDNTALARVLITSLDALAVAGQPDMACRLAGQACAAVRQSDPATWQRLNVFLHRMIKHVTEK
jgi:hypothetical protein